MRGKWANRRGEGVRAWCAKKGGGGRGRERKRERWNIRVWYTVRRARINVVSSRKAFLSIFSGFAVVGWISLIFSHRTAVKIHWLFFPLWLQVSQRENLFSSLKCFKETNQTYFLKKFQIDQRFRGNLTNWNLDKLTSCTRAVKQNLESSEEHRGYSNCLDVWTRAKKKKKPTSEQPKFRLKKKQRRLMNRVEF